MLPFEDRYTRQRQLPEVGETGQQRIEALAVELPPGSRAQVARVYLERAGVRELRHAANASDTPFRHAQYFRHEVAARVGGGTHFALTCLRRALLGERTADARGRLS